MSIGIFFHIWQHATHVSFNGARVNSKQVTGFPHFHSATALFERKVSGSVLVVNVVNHNVLDSSYSIKERLPNLQ